MLLELILALVIGVSAGTITGLFPGIHINLVAAGLLALLSSGKLDFFSISGAVVFIVAMSITHTFIDFIPSIFLGAPEEDSFLAVLPGHQLLQEGKGLEAVVLTLYGGLVALPIILIFSFLFVIFLPTVFSAVQLFIPFILIFVSVYLVFREEEFLISLSVFLLAGFLGLMTFNLPVKEPLLPLLSGLFGLSGLILSVRNKTKIPKQKFEKLRKIKLERKYFWRASFAAFVAAPLCSFLPGIGSGHAAVVGSEIMGEKANDRRAFLFLVGILNTIVMGLSFVTVYAIQKGRTGSAVAVLELLHEISFQDLILIIIVVFAAAFFAFFVGLYCARVFSRIVNKVDYSKISFIVIGILICVNLILSNWIGLIVFASGAALGVFSILSNVRRINLMGCLLLPSIVYYMTI